jgi:hypothetical protein
MDSAEWTLCWAPRSLARYPLCLTWHLQGAGVCSHGGALVSAGYCSEYSDLFDCRCAYIALFLSTSRSNCFCCLGLAAPTRVLCPVKNDSLSVIPNSCNIPAAAQNSTAHEVGHVLLSSKFGPVHDPAISKLMYAFENRTGDPPAINAAQLAQILLSASCIAPQVPRGALD